MIKQRIEFQKDAIAKEVWICCPNCIFWFHKLNKCNKFNMTPPGDVIVTGCFEWLTQKPF